VLRLVFATNYAVTTGQ